MGKEVGGRARGVGEGVEVGGTNNKGLRWENLKFSISILHS